MTERKLRAVAPGETQPVKKPPMTVVGAAADGSERDLLVAVQARVARAMDDPNVPGAALAALSRQLQDVAEKLKALDAREAEELRDADASPDEVWSEEAI